MRNNYSLLKPILFFLVTLFIVLAIHSEVYVNLCYINNDNTMQVDHVKEILTSGPSAFVRIKTNVTTSRLVLMLTHFPFFLPISLSMSV